MDQAIKLHERIEEQSTASNFALDTTVVLFFLAMDLGASGQNDIVGTFLALVTVGIFIVVPYVLPFAGERPEFAGWAVRRTIVAVLGTIAGILYGTIAVQFVAPGFGSLPMTLLIVSAAVSCYVQLHAILTMRLAR